MKDFIIKDYISLAEVMVNDVRHNKTSMAVLFYDDAIDVIKALASKPRVVIHSISIDPPDWDNYTKEYVITLDEDWYLFVEPIWRKKNKHHDAGYIIVGADIMYIDSRADKSIYERAEYGECYEVRIPIGEEDDIYSYYPGGLKCKKCISYNNEDDDFDSDVEIAYEYDENDEDEDICLHIRYHLF